jgi:hypothetical protein
MQSTLTRDQAIGVMSRRGLHNPTHIYDSSLSAQCDLAAACALMQKESGGNNVYGNDPGAMAEGFTAPPNEDNFALYWFMVIARGATPNGVGPSQITSPGLIQEMINQGLKPYDIQHNMIFGFQKIQSYRAASTTNHPWRDAALRYNGSTAYADDFVAKRDQWKIWLSYA